RDASALAPEDVVLDDEHGRDEVSAAFLSLERGRYASTPDQHIIAEHGAEQGALEADGFDRAVACDCLQDQAALHAHADRARERDGGARACARAAADVREVLERDVAAAAHDDAASWSGEHRPRAVAFEPQG